MAVGEAGHAAPPRRRTTAAALEWARVTIVVFILGLSRVRGLNTGCSVALGAFSTLLPAIVTLHTKPLKIDS